MKELKIISKEHDKLFSRTKLIGEVVTEGTTPSREEVCKALASNLKKPLELVIVSSLNPKVGSSFCDFEAFVYDSKEALDNFEYKHIVKRHKHLAPKEKEESKDE